MLFKNEVISYNRFKSLFLTRWWFSFWDSCAYMNYFFLLQHFSTHFTSTFFLFYCHKCYCKYVCLFSAAKCSLLGFFLVMNHYFRTLVYSTNSSPARQIYKQNKKNVAINKINNKHHSETSEIKSTPQLCTRTYFMCFVDLASNAFNPISPSWIYGMFC